MKKLISYIFPIYNEAGNIERLFSLITSVTQNLTEKYDLEFICINDGSRDNSLTLLKEIREKDSRFKIINFSRNFGHQIAVTAGLDLAKGDAVIIMDSDLQDPPKVSLELITKWEEGFEVVYAQRRTRKDSFFKKLSAHLFYRTLDRLADIRIPKDTGDFRLMDRKVVNALCEFREKNRFLRGLVSYIGFKQIAVKFDRDERYSGETGYPLKKMIKFALDGITGFSNFPLIFVLRLGAVLFSASLIFLTGYLLVALFSPWIYLNFSILILGTILLVGGIQLLAIGLIGLYIGRIYSEVQNRPLYIVSEKYE